jgi:hypothetical protein
MKCVVCSIVYVCVVLCSVVHGECNVAHSIITLHTLKHTYSHTQGDIKGVVHMVKQQQVRPFHLHTARDAMSKVSDVCVCACVCVY